MTVHGIGSDEEYHHTLSTVSMLIDLDPARGSSDGGRPVEFVQLIGQYEAAFVQDLAPSNWLVEPG